jgi:hypothetical protein
MSRSKRRMMARFVKTVVVGLFVLAQTETAQAFSLDKSNNNQSNSQSNSQTNSQNSCNSNSHHRKHDYKKYDDTFYKMWLAHFHHGDHRHPASSSQPQMPAGYCPVPFEKTVTPVKIQGHNIYINLSDLDFLKNPGFVLQEADFDLTVQGRHHKEDEISISVNGLKIRYPGHTRLNDLIQYIISQDTSRTHFHMQNFKVKGIESFDHYLARVKKNHGLLKISLYREHGKILAAKITFKGLAAEPCNTNPGGGDGGGTDPGEDLSQYAVHIDSIDPSANPTAQNSIAFTFSSTKTDGTYWCSVDQATFDKCQSPVSYSALSAGSHTFQVFATTPKGTDAAKTSYTWSVDNIKPVVTITNAALLPTLTNNTSISFEFTSTKLGTFRCSLDGDTLYSCQSPMTYNVTNDGVHTFSVTAIDTLGNVSGSPAVFQWTLDTTAPTANLVSVVPVDAITSSTTKTMTFAANETSDFECALDQAAFSACQSPMTLNQLTEGTHIFAVRAIDLAGNTGAAVSTSWTNDYTAPQLTLGNIVPAAAISNSQNISVEFSTSEPSTVYCQLDSGTASVCTSPFTQAQIVEGQHQLVLYAIDQAGNRGTNVIVNWTVDLTAPVISFGAILPSAASNINRADMSFAINASESLTLSATLNGQQIAAANPLLLSGLAEGQYTLMVSGYDIAGNASNTISHTFTVDLTAPTIALSSEGPSLSNVDNRTFIFGADENVTFECSLDDGGFNVCQSPTTYSGLADGDHNFTLRATDAAGNVSISSFSWTQDTTAPQTFQTNSINGNSITIALSASEVNVTYACSLDSVPISPCNSSITYNNLSVGTHTFLARSTDLAGNTDPIGASFSFTIAAPIQTIITSSSPPNAIVNVNYMTISFTADQPAQGFVCSLDGAVFTSCVSAVTYTGLTDGQHTVLIKAIDQFGNMDPVGATKTWTVDTQAPVVSNVTTSVTTSSITVSWTTSEPATAEVNYGVGSALNQNTAEITTLDTTHSIKLVGLSSNTTYSIRVMGKDAAGNSYVGSVITARTSR